MTSDSPSQGRSADAAPASLVDRLFPNDLPISRRLWLPLALIELLLSSVFVFNLLTMARECVVGMEGLSEALAVTCSFCAVLFFPLLMLIFGQVRVRYPSVICVACSIISLAALAIFFGRSLLIGIKKRLHF